MIASPPPQFPPPLRARKAVKFAQIEIKKFWSADLRQAHQLSPPL